MDEALYATMAEVEDAHWWWRARRAIIDDLIGRLGLAKDAAILDLGCGTGGNLPMLARHGRVVGCETEPAAITVARGRGACAIEAGQLPDRVPFEPGSFDLVTMLDVLEHIEDDRASVAAVARLLRPGGRFVVTVPALPWLWTPRDEAHHHFRRYTRRSLRAVVAEHFQVQTLSYYNTFLFPLAAAARLTNKWVGGAYKDDLKVPPAAINGLLRSIFTGERFLLGRLPLPIGLSLMLVAQRPAR